MQQAVPPGTPPVLHGYTHCRNTILCRYCSAISLPSLFVCSCFFLLSYRFFSLYIIFLFFFRSFFIFLISFFFLSFLLSLFPLLLSFVYISFLPVTFSLLFSPSFFMAFLRIQHQNMVLRFPTIVKSEVHKKIVPHNCTRKGTPIAPFTRGGRGGT